MSFSNKLTFDLFQDSPWFIFVQSISSESKRHQFHPIDHLLHIFGICKKTYFSWDLLNVQTLIIHLLSFSLCFSNHKHASSHTHSFFVRDSHHKVFIHKKRDFWRKMGFKGQSVFFSLFFSLIVFMISYWWHNLPKVTKIWH